MEVNEYRGNGEIVYLEKKYVHNTSILHNNKANSFGYLEL